jgi:hypothetical protein
MKSPVKNKQKPIMYQPSELPDAATKLPIDEIRPIMKKKKPRKICKKVIVFGSLFMIPFSISA